MIMLTPEIMNDWKNALSKAAKQKSWEHARLLDSMNSSQYVSKSWVVEELLNLDLPLSIKRVAILGGWYAPYLPEMILSSFNSVKSIINFDSDPSVGHIAVKINNRHRKSGAYACILQDVVFDPIRIHKFDLVINTSCEHMINMNQIISESWTSFKDSFFVLQSTNERRHDDHINCVDSVEELVIQSGLGNIIYTGEKILPNDTTRYMVIGHI